MSCDILPEPRIICVKCTLSQMKCGDMVVKCSAICPHLTQSKINTGLKMKICSGYGEHVSLFFLRPEFTVGGVTSVTERWKLRQEVAYFLPPAAA